MPTPREENNKLHKTITLLHTLLILLCACTNTQRHTKLSRLWSCSCHDLNSCSKAYSSHPSTSPAQPHPPFFFSLLSRREWKWHFWACIPQLALCRAPAWQRHIQGSVRLKLYCLWSSVTRQGIQTRRRTSTPWSCESQPSPLKSDEE